MTRRDLVAIALLTAFVSAFWIAKVWLNRPDTMSPHARDLYASYLPNIQYSVQEMRAGRMPLWNPYEFTGMPMLATLEHGPLYPFTAIYALGDIAEMHLLSGFVHTILFGAFMFLFARSALNVGAVPAIFSALVVMMSGWTASRSLIYPDEFRSGIYIPLALFFADRIIVTAHSRWNVGLAITLALQFLAGELEIVVRTGFLLLAFVVYRSVQTKRSGVAIRAVVNRVKLFATACAVAMLLVAAQLVPTWQLSKTSLRSTAGISYEQAVDPIDGGVEQPAQLLELLVNDGGPPYVFYIGIVPLLFAAYAVMRRRPNAWFFGGAAVLLFMLILGDGTPLYRAYYNLPTGDWFRFPLRLQPFLVISVAILAALGLNQWLIDRRAASQKMRTAALVFTIAMLAASILFDMQLNGIESTVALAAAAALVLLNVRIARAEPTMSPAFSLAAIAIPLVLTPILAFDLSVYVTPKRPDLVGLPSQVQDAIKQNLSIAGRVYIDVALEDGRRVPKYGLPTRTPCLDGFSPFMPAMFWEIAKDSRASRLQESADALESEGHESSLGLWGGLSAANGALDIFDFYGVECIVVGPGSELFRDDGRISREDIPKKFEVIAEVDGIFVLKNSSAWPRAFVLTEDFDIDDLSHTGSSAIAGATILSYAPARVVIDITTDQPGHLALTDHVDPGWKAYADGTSIEIPPVDHPVWRLVLVDGSINRIEFLYKPHGFTLGCVVSITTMAAIASWSIVARRTRHNSKVA